MGCISAESHKGSPCRDSHRHMPLLFVQVIGSPTPPCCTPPLLTDRPRRSFMTRCQPTTRVFGATAAASRCSAGPPCLVLLVGCARDLPASQDMVGAATRTQA